MKTPTITILIITTVVLFTGAAVQGQNASPAVGGVLQTLPAKKDRAISLAFERAPAFQGFVRSVAGNKLVFRDPPGGPVNAFAPGSSSVSGSPETYYLRFTSGALEGRYFRVLSSTPDSVTVELPTGANLRTVKGWNAATKTGDVAKIVPYWTPASLLPAASASAPPPGFVATTAQATGSVLGVLANQADAKGAQDVLMLAVYRTADTGVDAGWYLLENGNVGSKRADSQPLAPGAFCEITTPGTAAQSIMQLGRVVDHKMILSAASTPTGRTRTYLAPEFPVPMTLSRLAMQGSSVFVVSDAAAQVKDAVYFPVSDQNTDAYKGYYFLKTGTGSWRSLGSNSVTEATAAILPPATPLALEKAIGPRAVTAGPINPPLVKK